MTSHVLLLRHGRTALNADGRLRGRLDPDLDDVGRDEVEATAQLLRRHAVDLVVTSPLARARQTAEAAARATGAPVVVDDRLADRDYGDFAGARTEEVVERYGSLDAAPGVEPRTALVARARAVLEEYGVRSGPGDVVLVSHDAVITLLLTDLGADPGGFVVPTASISDVRREDGAWVVDAVGVVPER